jgi:hypothetical protein
MNIFGFLCDFKIGILSAVDLTKHCSSLELALKNNESSSTDVDKNGCLVNFESFHIFC